MRSCLFEDLIFTFKNPSFDISYPFLVKFVGEPVVDVGGLKREIFRIFLQEMSQFSSTEDGLFPVHNVTAVYNS